MFFSTALSRASSILRHLNQQSKLLERIVSLSSQIRRGVSEHAVVQHKQFGIIYAYEIDGYGSTNMMDDANTPSLLSIPLFGYLDPSSLSHGNDDLDAPTIYANTRRKALSMANPYYAQGTAISGIGSPHTGPGRAWPMAAITRIMTSEDEEEIVQQLRMLLRTTDGLGLMHESVNAFDGSDWSRNWFAWANSHFGRMILDLEKRMPHVLDRSFQ